MRKQYWSKWFLVMVFIQVFLNGYQTVLAQGNLPSEEVTINKVYRPLLADAVKITSPAVPAAIDTASTSLTYTVAPHVIDVPFVPAEIKPVALAEIKPEPTQNNFIKAGFGMQLTPLLDVHLSNGRNDKFSYGLNLNHLSSSGSKINFQDQSHTAGSLYGTSYLKNTSLSANLSYDRDVYHFYGFNADFFDSLQLLSKNLLKQQFQNIALYLGFKNTKSTKHDIDYNFDFNFHSLNDLSFSPANLPSKENYFEFDFGIAKQIQKIHSAHLDFNFKREDFKSQKDTSINYFSILPNYQMSTKKAFLKVGANVSVVGKEVNLFPEVEGSYKLLDDYFIPYLGIHGNEVPNTMKAIADVNPFINTYQVATSKILTGYLGFRGSYGNNITYNAKLNYTIHKNLPVYLPVSNNPTYFAESFYSKATIIGVNAEVGFKQSERLNMMLSGLANSYDMNGSDEPWGIPKSKLTFAANYNIQNKIFIQADIFGQSGISTIIPGDTISTQLKGFVDLNLSTTYNYKKNIALWISFNNIAAMKQREFYNYQYYGFRVMAGAIFKF